jgi:hypothetical protein
MCGPIPPTARPPATPGLLIACQLPRFNSQLNESHNLSEQILFNRRQQLNPRGDYPGRMTKARQEAEALFTSKRSISEPSFPGQPTPDDQSARKPRILRALSIASVRHEEGKASVSSEERMTSEIPRSQFARIRAWVKYGMTAAQVAGVYGVGVDVIERILAHA